MRQRIGTGIDPREPFSLYTLAMAKEDSNHAIKPYKEYLKRRQMWREAGYTIISLAFLIGWSALATLQV